MEIGGSDALTAWEGRVLSQPARHPFSPQAHVDHTARGGVDDHPRSECAHHITTPSARQRPL